MLSVTRMYPIVKSATKLIAQLFHHLALRGAPGETYRYIDSFAPEAEKGKEDALVAESEIYSCVPSSVRNANQTSRNIQKITHWPSI